MASEEGAGLMNIDFWFGWFCGVFGTLLGVWLAYG